jgi:DNA-binding NtrC family response regulator
LSTLEDLAASSPDGLILHHVDKLAPELARATAAVLDALPDGVRLVATSSAGPGSGHACEELLSRFVAVVAVPALRDRVEDVPDLVRCLTSRRLGLAPGTRPGVRWMNDALLAMSRAEWTNNVASLDAVVGQVLAKVSTEYVGAHDLPPDMLVRATRRRLVGLERLEAVAILQAVQEADGNKHQAAAALGIARSTLYRKMRSLGVDMTSSRL